MSKAKHINQQDVWIQIVFWLKYFENEKCDRIPVTRQEVIEVLEVEIKRYTGMYGGTHAMILSDIKRALEENPDLYSAIFKNSIGYGV